MAVVCARHPMPNNGSVFAPLIGSSKKLKSKSSVKESIEDWEIPLNEILTGCRIGSGSFGTVYRGHWHGPVALKKLNVSNPKAAQLQVRPNYYLWKQTVIFIILLNSLNRPLRMKWQFFGGHDTSIFFYLWDVYLSLN